MKYWLFKSEPSAWLWEKQKAAGKSGTEWSGIRNYQARNNMRAMAVGDRGFFYHSNTGLDIVGIVEICKTVHRDSTTDDERWECVDIRAVADMAIPVAMDKIRANPKLREMVLVKNSRLSVQPVSTAEWAEICKLGGIK